MSSTMRAGHLLMLALALGVPAGGAAAAEPTRQLRVCADPNNLPFSNERQEGFENKIAALIAADLNATLEYTWWAQRRGFIRNTLRAGKCDLVLGVPADFELVLPTKPYYRSSYVFVYRKDRALELRSLDDPILRELRIGVQIIGDDYSNTPPSHALARRDIIDNVVGYTVYGDYSQPNPPARIIDAVAHGATDVALVWGPLAGYFARFQSSTLEVVPIEPALDPPNLPMQYDIAMGVRWQDRAFKREIDMILERRRARIDAILREYAVPLIERDTSG